MNYSLTENLSTYSMLRYQGWNSTYFRESHYKLRGAVREFVERELMPFAGDWDERRVAIPGDMWERCAKVGIFAAVSGVHWPTEYLSFFLCLLFCFVLFCFVFFCFVLFCFVLFCFVLYCIVLFCILLYFIVFYCILFYFTLFYCILFLNFSSMHLDLLVTV